MQDQGPEVRGKMPTDGFVLLGQADPPAAPASAVPPVMEEEDGWAEDTAPEGIGCDVMELGALLAELEPNRPEQVVLTLAGAVGEHLAGRAAFLGMISAEAAEGVAGERDWRVLLGLGLSVSQLALLVQAEPWLPPVQAGVPFCDWLVQRGVLSAERVAELLDQSVQFGWPLFQVALEQAALDESTYLDELARFTGLQIALPPDDIPRGLLVGFPLGWVEHFELVPLRRSRNLLRVAAAVALPAALRERLTTDVGMTVELQLGSPSDVAAWRRRWLQRWWDVHRPERTE